MLSQSTFLGLVRTQETFLKSYQQILQSSIEAGEVVSKDDIQELSRVLTVLDVGLGRIVTELLEGQLSQSERELHR